MMAILFCTCDGILNCQNIYYKYWSIPRKLRAQQLLGQRQPAIANCDAEALLATTPHDAQGKTVPGSPSGSSSYPDASPVKAAAQNGGDNASVPAAHRLRSLSAGMHAMQT